MKVSAKKNFDLSETEFLRLIEGLKQGDEKLFEKVFVTSHKSVTYQVSRSLNVDQDVAYDIFMDALILLRKKILADKISYGNLNFLLLQICRQLHIQSLRKKDKNKQASNTYYETLLRSSNQNEEFHQALQKSWYSLGDNCQNLLRDFYYKELDYSQLSVQFGKSEVALRKQKERCISKLKSLVNRYFLTTKHGNQANN